MDNATSMIKHLMVHRFRILLLSLLLTLSGCFSFSFWFERLDTLVLWQLDRMLDFSDGQKDKIKPELTVLVERVRAETVPPVITSLTEVQHLWDNQKPRQALFLAEHEINLVLDTLRRDSWPTLARTLDFITEDNIEAYLEWVGDNRDDWYEHTLSDRAKQQKRTEMLKDWLGRLSTSQKSVVADIVKLHTNERQTRIENGEYRRSRFIGLIEQRDWVNLEQAWQQPELLQTEEYQLWRTRERDQTITLLHTLIPTLSAEQQQHVSKRLDNWIARLHKVKPATLAETD